MKTVFIPKTEIKNLNSFRAVEEALKYEIKRQTSLWESNKAPKTEVTRGWDAQKGITVEQRSKEKLKIIDISKSQIYQFFLSNLKIFLLILRS